MEKRRSSFTRSLYVVSVFGAFASPALPAAAQDALVLSGGGSRGLAHAGAIVGLERNGFRPELVVGASIGAIMGGLYASGLAPDSLWSIARQQDWQELFAPAPLSLGPAWDARRPLLALSLFVDRSRFTDGFIPDWRVNRLLVRLFYEAGARAGGDFDALPRRFRSVTADLRTGDTHVIARGDLALAIRASMAVPGAFAPVLLDGAPLVDGGLSDYLPVGPARRTGASRVVAVDVLQPPSTQVGLNPYEVALRALRFMLSNAREEHAEPDVLIAPDIDPNMFAAMFPRDPSFLLEAGLAASLAVRDELGGGNGARPPKDVPAAINALWVQANDPTLEALVREAFDDVVGRPWNAESVFSAVDDLLATGLFSGVWPHIEQTVDGTTLIVRADAVSPTTLLGAFGYDTDRGFRAWATIRRRIDGPHQIEVSVSSTALDRWAGMALRGPLVSTLPQLGLDAGGAIASRDIRTFAEGDLSSERRIGRAAGWLGLDWRSLSPEFEVGALLRVDRVDVGATTGTMFGPAVRVAGSRPNAEIVGTPTRLEAEWRFGDFEYRHFAVGGSLVKHSGRLSAALVADVEVVSGDAPLDVIPALGDAHAIPGLRWGRFRGPARALAGADLALATPLESYLRMRVRTGAVASDLRTLGTGINVTGVDAAIMWWTPFGRIAFDAGVTTDGDWRIGFDVGPRF